MLINGDAKALEWLTCVYLAQDPVGMEELRDPSIDMHTDNQRRFDLPERVVAKIFLFRLIFGGSAFSYAHDPDFSYVSNDPRFWQDCIDKFYDKYRGIAKWHQALMREVQEHGKYTLPTGRTYVYKSYLKQGIPTLPRTKILNYPVQGLGADLMMVARVALWRAMQRQKLNAKLISTVHDSVLVDAPDSEVDTVVGLFFDTWDRLPQRFENLFGVEFNLPCRVEVQKGPVWGKMQNICKTCRSVGFKLKGDGCEFCQNENGDLAL